MYLSYLITGYYLNTVSFNFQLILAYFQFFVALEGYLHQLSPIKAATKSQTNFFDCSLQTSEKESVHLVCYSPKQRPTLQQAFAPFQITLLRKEP